MSLATTLGTERNLFDETPEHAHKLILRQPILLNRELETLRHVAHDEFSARTFDITWPIAEGAAGMERALERLCARAQEAIAEGVNILILSDRSLGPLRAPIPSLLAVSTVHHHLVREGTRLRAGIVLESGEPREVHHFATLIGYGVSAVNPYLMLETLDELAYRGMIERPANGSAATTLTSEEASQNVVKAIGKGLLKTISKMGISTIQSYRSAQIFEAVGLSRELIDRHFTGTASRIGGVGLPELAPRGAGAPRPRLIRRRTTTSSRWAACMRGGATASATSGTPRRSRSCSTPCAPPTTRRWARRSPGTQQAHESVRESPAYARYREYARAVNEDAARRATLRGLLEFVGAGRAADRAGGGRAREGDRQALLHRRDEPRLDLARGARDAGDRDEPPRRALQHRRGRRGPRALPARPQRRPAALGDQAGRLGALRRDDPLPRQRRRAADQDGAGRQARRGRPAAGPQGRQVHRLDSPHHPRRRPDLTAAPPRHLLDRGSQAADLRPALLQPAGAGVGEAGRPRSGSARWRRASPRPTPTAC